MFSSLRQIRDINNVLNKNEVEIKKKQDKPIKKMSMEQRHQMRMLYFEEEKKLYEIKRREKMLKMVEKQHQYNLTIKGQLEQDKKILEKAKDLVMANMEQLKIGVVPTIFELEQLLVGSANLQASDLTNKQASNTGEQRTQTKDEKSEDAQDRSKQKKGKDKTKKGIDKFDFR